LRKGAASNAVQILEKLMLVYCEKWSRVFALFSFTFAIW
jgi:hypothetical protein